jgi:hypothetical protein
MSSISALASTSCRLAPNRAVGWGQWQHCPFSFVTNKDHIVGWVVYSKKTNELLRYYDTESKAQAQVTGHNKKAVWYALTRTDSQKEEWACCEWGEYETVFKGYYEHQKAYMLQRSSYR